MPSPSRRSLLAAATATAVLPVAHAAAQTAAWPRRPVRLLVPYAPGGGTDVFARTLAEGLRPILGQPVLVENRAGANGLVGSEVVARGEADGHLFLVDTGSHVMNAYVMPNMPFQPLRDFAPVALLSRFPMLLAVGAAQPWRNVAELLAAARAAPRSIGFGTSDAAISYAGNLFTRLAGVEMVEVAYRGAAPMLNDLIAGHLPTSWNSTVAALPHLQGGRIRALGVTTAARTSLLPEVPTLAEAGVPGYEFAGWYGMVAPAALPPAIAVAMHAAIAEALRDAGIRERLSRIGADLGALGPAEFATFLREDDARWAQAARDGLIVRAQ
ncbi:tripartite tricarboxylate transporter substrate-binding protein [Plastoroseomonas hellenica]|uniref:tripartite tricarboxylate transporter substrate-binding protein n=1 Tax=Plastoroseomonas hellenica TaxID=2687306 RepID=UPI001BAB2B1B|nr:tripartite tricarboxylate transporter substrate-binding protein [Plastoroseomonas hellenica]MBR0645451.1 tripartite tricarboxylate transporter substrate binding protein [Plastoroseomonas hellenica]